MDKNAKHLRLWLIIFFVCFLFTVTLWDYYFNSEIEINQRVVSHLVLFMGTLFSVTAALFARSVENRRNDLEEVVEKRTEELRKRNQELEETLKEVKVLRGFIPICASCKKIRNDEKGYWQQIEVYLQQHSEAQFSHGLCETCIKKLYPKQAKGDIHEIS